MVVHRPQTAADLVPHYPLGCKRVIIDQGYFPTFNRDNVELVSLRRTPIERVVPAGIELADGAVLEVDAIVYATGFDAMTGALSRIDVRGRDGVRLGDMWAESPKAYLGVAVSGFPNLFTVTGPGSPSVLTNMVTSIEHHVEWITALLVEMRSSGRLGRARDRAGGTDPGPRVMQLLVSRRQRARQDAAIHAVLRRTHDLHGPVRRDRRGRVSRVPAHLIASGRRRRLRLQGGSSC